MQEMGEIEKKHIIIGSPLQANNLWKKDKVISIVIPEVDYLFSFGYGDAL
jgi:hypothetical protein